MKNRPSRPFSYAYPDQQMRNRLSGALGARVPRGGLDPIYYAFAGIPIGGQYNSWGFGGGMGGGGFGGGGSGTGGGGTTNPPGGGTTNPPAGGGGTTPPYQWTPPQLMNPPFGLGADWRATMMKYLYPNQQ